MSQAQVQGSLVPKDPRPRNSVQVNTLIMVMFMIFFSVDFLNFNIVVGEVKGNAMPGWILKIPPNKVTKYIINIYCSQPFTH